MSVLVVLGSIMPAAFSWRPDLDPSQSIKETNKWLCRLASQRGLRYIDYHSKLVTSAGGPKSVFYIDGLHLSAAGYRLIEPPLIQALRTVLGHKFRTRTSGMELARAKLSSTTEKMKTRIAYLTRRKR